MWLWLLLSQWSVFPSTINLVSAVFFFPSPNFVIGQHLSTSLSRATVSQVRDHFSATAQQPTDKGVLFPPFLSLHLFPFTPLRNWETKTEKANESNQRNWAKANRRKQQIGRKEWLTQTRSEPYLSSVRPIQSIQPIQPATQASNPPWAWEEIGDKNEKKRCAEGECLCPPRRRLEIFGDFFSDTWLHVPKDDGSRSLSWNNSSTVWGLIRTDTL